MGEPEYPSAQIPLPVSDLVAVERGDRILISFGIAPRTTDGALLKSVRGIDLRAGATPIAVTAPEEPGHVSASVPVRDFVGKQIVISERTLGPKNHYSEVSNRVTLDVLPPVAAPVDLAPKATPDGVALSWSATGATSFRIFRRDENAKTPAQIGESKTASYTDTTSEFDKHYEYWVQALHDKAESETTGPVSITPKDIFPPPAPTGLTAAIGVGTIELAWERSVAPDLKTYVIYRAEGGGPMQKLAEADSPVYTDRAIKSGTTYRYAVSAVDQKNNESDKSATAEALAP